VNWLTARIERLAASIVPTMSPQRQAWGAAVVAELAAVPPGERRLRWAWGALWFILRHGITGLSLVSRVFAGLGVLSVAPWLLFSVQGIRETDAPDATLRSMVGTLVAQSVLVIAFLATWWPSRAAGLVLVLALVGYAVTTGFAAADNDGSPLLAAAVFTAPPAMAALPILAIGHFHRLRRLRTG
jgi:predicted anti-sigma-YlaC factor YlaD